MRCQELRQSRLCLAYELFGEEVGEGWVLLGLLHVRHREKNQLLLIQLHLWSPCLQVLLEGCRAGVVKQAVPFEVGVHAVDAEIDADVELQPPSILVNVPILAGDPEELIPTASIKDSQDGIAIGFVPVTGIDLCLGFQVGPLISEGVVSPVIAIEEKMLLDQL